MVVLLLTVVTVFAVSQSINYQGKLTDMDGVGENDTLDIRFRVFDVPSGGDSLWAMTVADVPIVRGMFDVNIGPIDLPFDEQYWLEIVVDGNTLAPRVQLTSSPYAFRAAVADSFTGGVSPWTQDTMIAQWDSLRNVPAGFADGVDDTGHFEPNTIDTNIAHWGDIRDIPGDIADGDQVIETRDTMIAHWDSVRGIPADFADGVDNIGQNDTMIAFWDSLRDVPPGFADGIDDTGHFEPNTIDTNIAHWGDIRDIPADIADGDDICDDDWNISDSVLYSANYYGIARGGAGNQIFGDSAHTNINLGVGGDIGSESDTVYYSVIGGGQGNDIIAEYSVINGGRDSRINRGADHSTIGGGRQNSIIQGSDYSTISGGRSNMINSSSGVSVISGGSYHNISPNSRSSVISGGYSHKIGENSEYAVISGGRTNEAHATYVTIPGGSANIDSAEYSFVFGEDNLLKNTAGHSVVFGLADTLSEDSTFFIGYPYVEVEGKLSVDSIESSLDTLYLPDKVWVEELVTDTIESRGDFVFVKDALGVEDSFYFDGEWRNTWPSGADSDWVIDGDNIYSGLDGNVGIGTDSPNALLHTYGTGVGEGNVVFVGENKMSSPTYLPVEGAGTRMMWYPDRAVLRVGEVDSTQWDSGKIGRSSIAMGYNTIASGQNSLALLYQSSASGAYSMAIGTEAEASDYYSTAIGYHTTASGITAIALGSSTISSGYGSKTLGTATTASGSYSTAMGVSTEAFSGYETVIGRYNTEYTPDSPTSWDEDDRLFVVANGTGMSISARSNALTILKNGNTGIGTDDPEQTLDVDGNALIKGLVITDSISSPLDTLYLPDKVWVDELVTDTIESRGDFVFVKDALGVEDSFYFDGEWRKNWPVVPDRFVQLRANGSAWLTDSVTFVEGSNITLTQTGDTIEIASTGGGGGANGWVDDGTVVRLETSTDKVGIGTTTPSDKLEIHDGSLFIEGDDNGAIRIGQGTDYYQMIIDYDANDEGTSLYFQTNGTDRIYFSNSGRLGIGTTSPVSRLDVVGDGAFTSTVSGADAVNDDDFVTKGQITGGTVSQWVTNGADIYNSNTGNVGIGTATPVAKLDISGSSIDGRGLYIHDATGLGHPDTGIVIRDVGYHGIYIDSVGYSGIGGDGINIRKPNDDGVHIYYPGDDGVYIDSPGDDGVHIHFPGDDGVQINYPGDDGVEIRGGTETSRGLYIHDAAGIGDPDTGIVIRDVGDHGIYIDSVGYSGGGGDGINIRKPSDDGVYIHDPGGTGVEIIFPGDEGVYIDSPGADGVYINYPGSDGVTINSPGGDGVEIMGGTSTGRGLYIQDASGIGDPDTGIVIRDVADHGIYIEDAGEDGLRIDSPIGDGMQIDSPGDNGLRINAAAYDGVSITTPGFDGVYILSPGDDGVYINSPGGDGVEIAGGTGTGRGLYIHDPSGIGDPDTGIVIRHTEEDGIYIQATGDDGIEIDSASNDGIQIDHAGDDGVDINFPLGDGVNIYSPGGDGVYVYNPTLDGVNINHAGGDGVDITNSDGNGAYIANSGSNGVYVYESGDDGVHINSTGDAGVDISYTDGNGVSIYDSGDDGINVSSSTNYDGYFNSDIYAATASAGIKSFLIDHPSDPEHKLLRHYSTESPEVLVTYRGKVELDGSGRGIITMPDYFPDLTDEDGVTVHLTPIGREPFIISYEWDAQNCEVHVYGKPNGEASYQVNAERDDPVKRYLVQPVESNKADGKYCPDGELLIPEAYGYPESRRRHYKQHQEALEQREEKK